MNLHRHNLENCIEGVSKHLNRAIRHNIDFQKWVNEIISSKIYFDIKEIFSEIIITWMFG